MKPAEFYTVRDGLDWCFIVVEETTGTFLAHGSFGTYAYTWSHRGPHTLKEFLRGLDMDYFMGKARGNTWMRFDAEATVDGLRSSIIERRRGGFIEKDDARAAWEDIEEADLVGYWNENEFFQRLMVCNRLMEFLGGDYFELARHRPSADCVGFWNQIWPKFLALIAPAAQTAA